jgi:hypothetical protein
VLSRTVSLARQCDVAASWTQAGKANLILDNPIAAEKAVPMIIVMLSRSAVSHLNLNPRFAV